MKTTIAIALLLSGAACGGSTASSQSSEGNPGPAGNVQPTSLTVRGVARGTSGAAVPGVLVCVERGTTYAAVQPDACVSSGPDGAFVVTDGQYAATATLTLRADGFMPLMVPFATTSGDFTVPPVDSVLQDNRGTILGISVDPTKGQVPFVVAVSGAPLTPRVTATATKLDYYYGFSGPGAPAVYADGNGSAAPGATGGTVGAFVNLDPGVYAMKFEFVGAWCTAGAGMPVSTTGFSGATSVFYADVRGGYVMAPVVVSCFVP